MTRFVTLFDRYQEMYIVDFEEFDTEPSTFWDKSDKWVQWVTEEDSLIEAQEVPEDVQMWLNGWPHLPGFSFEEVLRLNAVLFWRNQPEATRQLALTCCNVETDEDGGSRLKPWTLESTPSNKSKFTSGNPICYSQGSVIK